MARRRTLRRLLLIGLAAGLASPASALAAGTVTVTGGDLIYTGDAGVNVVTFTDAPGNQTTVTVSETGISESPDVTACFDSGDSVVCEISDNATVEASFGAGNDVGTVNSTRVRHELHGDEDGDELTGSEAVTGANGAQLQDQLDGGVGADRIFGRGGGDFLRGGQGADLVDGGSGDTDIVFGDEGNGDVVDGGSGDDFIVQRSGDGEGDVLRGGSGFDEIDYQTSGIPAPGAIIDLTGGFLSNAGGSERATLEAFEGVDGTEGEDRITGTNGRNEVFAQGGNDQIDGLGGGDLLDGDLGDDTIQARDGVNDRVDGDLGTDTCLLDQFDEQDGCESAPVAIVAPFGTPPPAASVPADQRGPVCSLRNLRNRLSRRAAIANGIGFTVVCDERGRVEATLLGRVRRLPPGARLAATGDFTFATTRRTLGARNRVNARLRISRRFRRAARRLRRVRIVIRATDSLGNVRTTSRTVRLR